MDPKLQAIVKDFHTALSALATLHARNEIDIERVEKEFVERLHELDRRLFAMEQQYKPDMVDRKLSDMIIMLRAEIYRAQDTATRADKEAALAAQRADMTPLGVPLPPRDPAPAQPTAGLNMVSWITQTKTIIRTYGPWFLGGLGLLLSSLQSCGVIKVQETPDHTVITVPGHVPHSNTSMTQP